MTTLTSVVNGRRHWPCAKHITAWEQACHCPLGESSPALERLATGAGYTCRLATVRRGGGGTSTCAQPRLHGKWRCGFRCCALAKRRPRPRRGRRACRQDGGRRVVADGTCSARVSPAVFMQPVARAGWQAGGLEPSSEDPRLLPGAGMAGISLLGAAHSSQACWFFFHVCW